MAMLFCNLCYLFDACQLKFKNYPIVLYRKYLINCSIFTLLSFNELYNTILKVYKISINIIIKIYIL